MPALLPLFCARVPETIKGRAPQSWRAISSACLHDVRYSLNVHCRRHGGGHAGRISGSIAEGGCHHVRQGNRNFSAAAIKLGEAITALNAVQAQIRAEALKFKRSPLPTSSRTTLGGRNIGATLHMRAGSHIGQPSGFLIWQALAPLFQQRNRRIIVATRHVPQRVHINTAEHGRARINLPLTNPSLFPLSQH